MKIKINEFPPYQLAFVVGIATFIGFSIVFPLMFLTSGFDYWGFIIIGTIYYLISGECVFGILLSIIAGIASFIVLKILSYVKPIKENLYIFAIIIAFLGAIIGFLSFPRVQRHLSESRSGKDYHTWKKDTNGDKRIDKWVHQDMYGSTIYVDYDNDYDGRADVREYFKDRKITSRVELNKK